MSSLNNLRDYLNSLTLKEIFYFCTIVLIISIASFLRSYNLSSYALGLDEVLHLNSSNYKSILDIFKLNFREAHPPLNYILIYIFTELSPTILAVRLPILIAGVALIITTYFLVIKITLSKEKAILAMIIISFGSLFIELSQGTRSYSLALLWTSLYLYNYFDKKKSYLILFGCLALFSDYSTILPILLLDLFFFLNNKKLTSLYPFLIHFFISIFQKILFITFSRLNFNNIYLDTNLTFTELLKKLFNVISYNFSSYNLIAIATFMLILLGLSQLLSDNKKDKNIKFFPIIFILLLLFCHFTKIYPILGDRYNIVHSYILLIFALIGLNKSVYLYTFIILLTILHTFNSTWYFLNDGDLILSKYNIPSLGHRKPKYKKIENYIKENQIDNMTGASTIKISNRRIPEDVELKTTIYEYTKKYHKFMNTFLNKFYHKKNTKYLCIDCTKSISNERIKIYNKVYIGYGRYLFVFEVLN